MDNILKVILYYKVTKCSNFRTLIQSEKMDYFGIQN